MDHFDDLILDLLEEEIDFRDLKEMGLLFLVTPEVNLWRSMDKHHVKRIKQQRVKTETFSFNRVVAEIYAGDIYRCNLLKPNYLFKLTPYGVRLLIQMALNRFDQIRYQLSQKSLENERLNCLSFIFRLIIATGCEISNTQYHQDIFERLDIDYNYEALLGSKPQTQNQILYEEVIRLIRNQVNDCIRHSYYWIDIPLINDYEDYQFSLPGLLKPLGIEGVFFYFESSEYSDDLTNGEVMIFSGPQNPIKIVYQGRSPGRRKLYPN